MKVADELVPYHHRLARRPLAAIELLVVHATELPTLADARVYAERIVHPGSCTGNCGHYYVDRDGAVVRYVADERVAHHVRGWNERSLGVELVYRGRYPEWYRSDRQTLAEPYPEPQIDALVALAADLRGRLSGLTAVAGHEDLDREWVPASDDPERRVRRKVDPGPLFPWDVFLARSGLPRFRP